MVSLSTNTPFELILQSFLKNETENKKRLSILSRLEQSQQLDLLIALSDNNNWDNTLMLLENFIIEENSIEDVFDLSKKLYDKDFWQGKSGENLVNLFIQYVNSKTTDSEKVDLFFKGYIKEVPHNFIKQNYDKLDSLKCGTVFSIQSKNANYILDILLGIVLLKNYSNGEWLYDLGVKYLDVNSFMIFDQNVYKIIDPIEYFKLWENNKARIFPEVHIETLLGDDYDTYLKIENWIDDGIITNDNIASYLLSYLQKQVVVSDRIIFLKQLNHIKYLLSIDEIYTEKIKEIKSGFYNLILWVYGKEESFDFDIFKTKFVYFIPEDQVLLIKKLFSLKAKNEFDLTVEKLNEISTIDLDLYQTNLNINSQISLDISTNIIINALVSFKERNKFIVESELLDIVLKNLKADKKRRFKFEYYFEPCQGRKTLEYNWLVNGEIEKINFGDNKFYFGISFSQDEIENATSRYRAKDDSRTNLIFKNLNEEVVKLSGSKWNSQRAHWGVPSQYETEVLNFARDNHFFLNFEGSNYRNNPHLASFNRTTVPIGISFCEGRIANKKDDNFDKEFWWCVGQKCFQKCESLHTPENWKSYTLLDFCEILGFNTDETNRMGEFIPKGDYYLFIGLINNFNRLLEKIYCHECEEILNPVDTSHFAAHSVIRFCCENENCGQHKKEVYLNHCLNGQCNTIIDSRVSKKCTNGLFICDNCGSCCSDSMFKRRLINLQTTGGYIHPHLIKCVTEKLGHLERAEYFCYKCKNEMVEIEPEVFECLSCNVKYDTKIFRFKRPHKHLRDKVNSNKKINENDGFELPF